MKHVGQVPRQCRLRAVGNPGTVLPHLCGLLTEEGISYSDRKSTFKLMRFIKSSLTVRSHQAEHLAKG